MVRRLYVEKKPGFDVEAKGLLSDIRESLGLETVEALRIINRYDIQGLDDETYDDVKFSVFAEPAIDNAYDEELSMPGDDSSLFAVELLPGQYDQRADSAEVCIKLVNPHTDAKVRFAKVIAVQGKISEEELKAIKEYVVNPVDSRLTGMEKLEDLELKVERPKDVAGIKSFMEMSHEQLMKLKEEFGFAMSDEDMDFVYDYFKNQEHRNPTVTELKVIDTYWSDHCRHTTFNTEITDISFDNNPYGKLVESAFETYIEVRRDVYGEEEADDESRPITLMDMAVIGTKYLKKHGKATAIDESDEINACSIKVEAEIDGKKEDWIVMFKNETHNHPTEIEPFGGAATCLGGAIRDPLSGRSYVYQAMRVTGSANPNTPVNETLKGKLPQKKIAREAAAGYSSYGNQIGLATGQVAEIYHENYVAKRMEVGAVVGAAPAENIRRKNPEKGDIVILVGGRTGRDGCGGATGSSKEHTADSINECGAEVQKGNPPVERNIQRLFRRREAAQLIKRCNDFGAGGVSVAIGELADSLDIDLDAVPKKYEGLDGTELAISESQERMAVVIAAEDFTEFLKYTKEENLEAVKVAEVTDTNRVKMHWRGQTVLDISRDFLNTNGVKQKTAVTVAEEAPALSGIDISELKSAEDLRKIISNINCCSQKGLTDRFDSTIGAATVLMPLGGKYQMTPSSGMAAKLPVVEGETETTTLMAYGFDPEYSMNSPYHGALYAVVDCVTKLVAMGGRRKDIYLSFQEYFEKLSSETAWGKPLAALLGGLKAQLELGTPAIGGKDSMSGTFENLKVPPTLISFGICATEASRVVSNELKNPGNKLLLLKTTIDNSCTTDFEVQCGILDRLEDLIGENKLLSVCPVGYGGAFMTLVKMAIGNEIGFDVAGLTPAQWAMSDYGSVIVEVNSDFDVAEELGGLEVIELGATTDRDVISVNGELKLSFDELIEEYEATLEPIFPTKLHEEENTKVQKISFFERSEDEPEKKKERPKVIIPTFPGTNCEMDSAQAFRKAGAEAEIFIIRNNNAQELEESIDQLASAIDSADILMIPGGFSGGDEPDGSAKFITAVFRNPKIAKATMTLVDERKGLILGICNGFQALIKLGLVPFGEILSQKDDSPTLTYNEIGRHMSCLVRTRIASVKSPWLAGVEVDDVFTIPVSHGEGKFICDPKLFKQLAANGQIVSQYVDMDGEPAMDIRYNPNGSAMAVEAITSPCGRILGKMGHSERIGDNLYKNVIGEKDMRLFESAVRYFKEK